MSKEEKYISTIDKFDGFDLDAQDLEDKDYMLTLTGEGFVFKGVFPKKRLLRLRDLLNELEK